MHLILFHISFAVGLAKYLWNVHQSSMIFGVLSALLLPKEVKHELSKAERSGNKTIHMEYIYRGVTYELVLPISSKPKGWVKCIATIPGRESDPSLTDVTDIVLRKSGPMKDFYGATLHAGQIIRGATELQFYGRSGLVTWTI